MAGSFVLGVAAPKAFAATTKLPYGFIARTPSGFSGSNWHVMNSNFLSATGWGSHVGGFGLNTAGLTNLVQTHPCLAHSSHGACTITTKRTFATHQTGAFGSGGLQLMVNGSAFKAPQGKIHVSDFDSALGNVIKASRIVRGVKVQFRIVIFPFDRRAAVLYSFTNPSTTSAIHVNALVGTSLGTPRLTAETTSDHAVTNSDAWFATAPFSAGTPTVTYARGNCGTFDPPPCTLSSILAAPDEAGDTPANWIERYRFKLRPKKTKRLLFYIELSKDAPRSPEDFNNEVSLGSAGLLAPFTLTELKQLINWHT